MELGFLSGAIQTVLPPFQLVNTPSGFSDCCLPPSHHSHVIWHSGTVQSSLSPDGFHLPAVSLLLYLLLTFA